MSANLEQTYSPFLSSRCARQWEKIGTARRGGVTAPLFSLYSRNSVGIGEIPDLKWLIDWCGEAGLSIIQLLPMNDVGFDFRPYDAQSSFALEPMFLALESLAGTDMKPFQKEIDGLRKKFPVGGGRVNYGIKAAKLELLWKIFEKNQKKLPASFEEYCRKNRYWLEDHALYKVIKEIHDQAGWEAWPAPYKNRDKSALETIHLNHLATIQFYKWLQWQLYEQFIRIKHYAERRGVLIMGDIPFLVSRDSVDVWAHQSYFKLELSSGAPPDLYFAKGQRWGMPPYNWDAISRHNYDYIVEKLRYASHFYDCFRIDHFVGVFRLWSIRNTEPEESCGLNGFFDPSDESRWEEHGRRIVTAMIEATPMLPCAEDLGTIPACSYKVLEEFGIPGIDVQRWTRDWDKSFDFKSPESYRKNSIANISTHDMSPLPAWWEYEAGTVDEILFRRQCKGRVDYDAVKERLFDLKRSKHGRLRWLPQIASVGAMLSVLKLSEGEARDFAGMHRGSFDEKKQFWKFLGFAGEPKEKIDPKFVRRALEKAGETASVFSIQLIQDWLSLDGLLPGDSWDWRINTPGSTSEKNWSVTLPFPLEKLKTLPINSEIRDINRAANRV